MMRGCIGLRYYQRCRYYQRQIRRKLSIQCGFVPKYTESSDKDVEQLKRFIADSRKLLILTGAGISTESGIPDYRSEEVGLYARTNHRPIQHLEFLKSPDIRQRYWARNFVGWERFSSSRPNESHRWVTELERAGKVSRIVTQNVDNLHFKAGSGNVIELHGSAYRVICLDCEAIYDRHYIQKRLRDANPGLGETSSLIRPDGDVEISQEIVDRFNPPICESCSGVLKPDIVFFGDNVPLQRVELVKESVAECDSVLVLGSSLSVFSGYRIILQAVDERKSVAIVNIGPTRADKLAQLKISTKCGEILSKILVDN